jgi:hypothetical protein
LSQIHAFSDDKLEQLHDWVQWLFPLPEASPFNGSAPVIDAASAAAFRSSPALRGQLKLSFLRVLRFYGFCEDGSGGVGVDEDIWNRAKGNWWCWMDHNHLRITRIIRSLRILGLEPEAETFFEALKAAKRRFAQGPGERSFMFWTRAAKRPLHIAPEEPDGDESGVVEEEAEDGADEKMVAGEEWLSESEGEETDREDSATSTTPEGENIDKGQEVVDAKGDVSDTAEIKRIPEVKGTDEVKQIAGVKRPAEAMNDTDDVDQKAAATAEN